MPLSAHVCPFCSSPSQDLADLLVARHRDPQLASLVLGHGFDRRWGSGVRNVDVRESSVAAARELEASTQPHFAGGIRVNGEDSSRIGPAEPRELRGRERSIEKTVDRVRRVAEQPDAPISSRSQSHRTGREPFDFREGNDFALPKAIQTTVRAEPQIPFAILEGGVHEYARELTRRIPFRWSVAGPLSRAAQSSVLQADPRAAIVREHHAHRFAIDHDGFVRSEEHTSELQSRSDLVCRLLLEKKKNIQTSQVYFKITKKTKTESLTNRKR